MRWASRIILLALLPFTRSAAAEIIVAGPTMHGNGTLKAGERDRSPHDLPYAHRGDGQRFVVHTDEKLTAFLELESVIHRTISF
jgi:hypothetical protein